MNFPVKSLCLIIFFLFASLSMASSQSIDSIFVNMPARVNPLLNRVARLNMLNNYKKNVSDSVKNSLGGMSIVIKYDSLHNFIRIQKTANSKMEIFTVKTTGENSAIGVISTVGDTVQNSEIQFFNPDWTPSEIVLRKPEIKDWIKPENNSENGTTSAWASEQTVVGFITLEYDAEKTILKAQHNFLNFLSSDIKNLVAPYFNYEPLKFVLQGNEWVKQ